MASLASEGLTNRQIARQLFVSAKTVDHHLSSIYAKLGMSSRRDLMLGARAGPNRVRGDSTQVGDTPVL